MPDSPGPEALFIRFYFDRHIMSKLAAELRARGFDILTTEEAGKDTASDEEQLAFATSQRRSILSFNIRDFAPLHEQWSAANRRHAGIVVSRQLGSRQFGAFLQRMLRLFNHFTAEEMIDNFVHLEQFK